MQIRRILLAALLWPVLATPIFAQFKTGDTEPNSLKLGHEQVTKWRVGMIVKASGGACLGMTGYAAVPTDWPEQEVSIKDEELSPGVSIRYQNVEGGAKVMSMKVTHLDAGEEAKALVTFEIRRSTILPPKNTDVYVLPDKKELPADIRPYLSPSPKIESRDPKIRELAKEIIGDADGDKAWDKVEAIYEWTRKKVTYKAGSPLKGAVAAIKDGWGDCEAMTSLFIALCRAADIPARTVWVEGHCYPEFYLFDADKKGHWFPCQVAGSREFGGIAETKPILQKGDNFRPPKKGKERQRYIAEYIAGAKAKGSVDPQVKFVRQTVAK